MPDEPTLRRWARDARLDWVTGGVVGIFVVLRLAAVLGEPVAVFNDSASYFDFRLWGGVRFPVVTAVYSLLQDHRAVVDVQAVVGVLAWSAAAVVAASVLERRWVRNGFVAVALALGLMAPVTTFDGVLLSESLAISATVLLVACVLRFACRPTVHMAVGVFVVAALWALLRQNHSFLLLGAAIVLAAIGCGRADRRLAWPLAGALCAVALVGVALASSTSQIQEYNAAQILVRRVLTDDAREQWFLDHGMPDNGNELLVPPYGNRFGDPAVELQEDPRYGRWLRRDFAGTYTTYLLTHPGYALGMPFGADGALTPLAVGTSEYGRARRVLPDAVTDRFWPRSTSERWLLGLLGLGIIAAGVVEAARGRGGRRALAGAGGVVVVVAFNVMFVTHSAGWEYERLLVPSGVALRFALVWLLATVLGGVSAPPATVARGLVRHRRDDVNTGRGGRRGARTASGAGSPGIVATTAADPTRA